MCMDKKWPAISELVLFIDRASFLRTHQIPITMVRRKPSPLDLSPLSRARYNNRAQATSNADSTLHNSSSSPSLSQFTASLTPIPFSGSCFQSSRELALAVSSSGQTISDYKSTIVNTETIPVSAALLSPIVFGLFLKTPTTTATVERSFEVADQTQNVANYSSRIIEVKTPPPDKEIDEVKHITGQTQKISNLTPTVGDISTPQIATQHQQNELNLWPPNTGYEKLFQENETSFCQTPNNMAIPFSPAIMNYSEQSQTSGPQAFANVPTSQGFGGMFSGIFFSGATDYKRTNKLASTSAFSVRFQQQMHSHFPMPGPGTFLGAVSSALPAPMTEGIPAFFGEENIGLMPLAPPIYGPVMMSPPDPFSNSLSEGYLTQAQALCNIQAETATGECSFQVAKPGSLCFELQQAGMWEMCTKSKKGCYFCMHCDQKFPNIAQFAIHLDESGIKREYKCDCEQCPWHIVGFFKRSEWKRHYKHQHSGKSLRCPVADCPKVFSRTDSLKRHLMLVHPPHQTSQRSRRRQRK